MPLWVPELLLFGSEMFTAEMPRMDAQPLLMIPLLVFSLAEFVLAMWSLALMCNTIAEVQGFRSAWRGLGNMMVAGLPIVVPLVLLMLLAALFVQLPRT